MHIRALPAATLPYQPLSRQRREQRPLLALRRAAAAASSVSHAEAVAGSLRRLAPRLVRRECTRSRSRAAPPRPGVPPPLLPPFRLRVLPEEFLRTGSSLSARSERRRARARGRPGSCRTLPPAHATPRARAPAPPPAPPRARERPPPRRTAPFELTPRLCLALYSHGHLLNGRCSSFVLQRCLCVNGILSREGFFLTLRRASEVNNSRAEGRL
eukprot:scaffold132408_cov27-Tisochrysis_lutea.AAC.1